jgi:CDP-glycerol glycerophosphotransferase
MPLLSVVMAAYNTERYVGAALASLVSGQWPRLEIIVVDDGSTDGTASVVAEFAASHRTPVIRLVRAPHRGPGAARNLGAGLATGRYLAFFDSDDVADPFFYRRAVRGLTRSGSDFALGAYAILVAGRRCPPPSYIRDLHHQTRRGATLADTPLAMTNALMCTRVYRRDFYERCVAPQPEGVFFEDQLVTMRGYVAATAFDVLHTPALLWRRRGTGDATTQRAGTVENLRERIAAYRAVADFLGSRGEDAIRRERLVQLLATDQLRLDQALAAQPEYLDVARQFLDWAVGEIGWELYEARVAPADRELHDWVARHGAAGEGR